jgi:hypothetical protein
MTTQQRHTWESDRFGDQRWEFEPAGPVIGLVASVLIGAGIWGLVVVAAAELFR